MKDRFFVRREAAWGEYGVGGDGMERGDMGGEKALAIWEIVLAFQL